MEARNDEVRIEIRKCVNLLRVTSDGVLIFGVWSLIKGVMLVLTDPQTGSIDGTQSSGSPLLSTASALAGVVLFWLIEMYFRLKVRRGARREADGDGKRKNFYLFVAMIMMTISVASMALTVFLLIKGYAGPGNTAASLMLEITSFVISFNLVRSAFRIRKLRTIKSQMEESD